MKSTDLEKIVNLKLNDSVKLSRISCDNNRQTRTLWVTKVFTGLIYERVVKYSNDISITSQFVKITQHELECKLKQEQSKEFRKEQDNGISK